MRAALRLAELGHHHLDDRFDPGVIEHGLLLRPAVVPFNHHPTSDLS